MLGNCEICGCYWTLDKHHLLPGTGKRRLAEEDGLYIFICRQCHNALHADENEVLYWRKEGERRYLKDHTFSEYMDRYGKNYLELEEIEQIENDKECDALERSRNESNFSDRESD